MKTYTVRQMLAQKPCAEYSRARIKELWAGRKELTEREILDLDIPVEDRLWAFMRASHPEWVERIVARAVRNHALRCGIPDIESWAVNWLNGADRSESAASAASDAAWAAARAAWAAASDAAWAAWAARAAWAAASDAAWAAASDAAWAAASDAAWAAASDAAERALQLQDAIDVLEGKE